MWVSLESSWIHWLVQKLFNVLVTGVKSNWLVDIFRTSSREKFSHSRKTIQILAIEPQKCVLTKRPLISGYPPLEIYNQPDAAAIFQQCTFFPTVWSIWNQRVNWKGYVSDLSFAFSPSEEEKLLTKASGSGPNSVLVKSLDDVEESGEDDEDDDQVQQVRLLLSVHGPFYLNARIFLFL